jgi:hypothetical protein
METQLNENENLVEEPVEEQLRIKPKKAAPLRLKAQFEN